MADVGKVTEEAGECGTKPWWQPMLPAKIPGHGGSGIGGVSYTSIVNILAQY